MNPAEIEPPGQAADSRLQRSCVPVSPIDTDGRYKDAYVPEPRVYTVNGATHRTIAAAAMTVAARPLLNLERLEAQEVATPFTLTEWRMAFDGEALSRSPSIGNCNYPAARTTSSAEAGLSRRIRAVTTRLLQGAPATRPARPRLQLQDHAPNAQTAAQRDGPGKVDLLGGHQPPDWDTLMRTVTCRCAGDRPGDSVAEMLDIDLGSVKFQRGQAREL